MLKSSVQDNFDELNQYRKDEVEPTPDMLDNSYIETAIFGLLKINISNLIQIKAALAKEFHIQPSEFEIMPYWEYELFVKSINDAVKEQNDKQQAEMDKYHVDETMKNINSGKFNSTPNIPNSSNMNLPDMSKMSMPKLDF